MECRMIKFDPNKLTFEYVYIRKIFKSFVEVLCDKERNIYESETVSYKRLKDQAVQIPIHYKVFSLYLKTNSLLHFDASIGKKACITFYDGKVLSLDVYRKSYFSGFETEDEWKSVNEGVFGHIKEMLKIHEDIYIDGESIFLMDKMIPPKMFKENVNFWIQPVRYVELSKMGVKKSVSKLLKEKDAELAKEKEKEEKNKANDSAVLLKNGYVLAYNPNADINPEDKEIIVYSPVFSATESLYKSEERSATNKQFRRNDETDKKSFLRNLDKIEDKSDPTVLNLNFVLKATRVIGEHYSFEDTDFLDIPKIIMETNIINLKTDISEHSRATYPVDINVWDGLAYIMRYCHIEDNLNVYRDLVSLFKFTLVRGFVSKKKTGDLFMEGKSMGSIKHYNYKAEMKKDKETKVVEIENKEPISN